MSQGTSGDSVEHAAGAEARGLQQAVARALEARERVRDCATSARLIAALAAAARAWAQPGFPPRTRVVAQLGAQTALHPEMLERGLDLAFASMNEAALKGLLLEAEVAEALDRPVRRDGRPQRLCGPPVVFHSLAGNVPALALPAIAASLLARSIAIVRDSARQRGLTEEFLTTLALHDADAAAMVVPVSWPSGDGERESEAMALAARAELSGSDTTLRALRARHRSAAARIVERGPRVSAGLVPAAASIDACASGFADDVVLYDGLGCLTPHVIFVAGATARAAAFAQRLAHALEARERRWPRQPRGLEAEAARRAFADECELHSLAREGEHVLRGAADAWLVHVTGAQPLRLGPGLRCVRVAACASEAGARDALARADPPLAAVGLAATPDSALDADLVASLRACGATLVCEAGRMQAPPLAWSQDGRRRLGDLLAWEDAET